jgi:hypothetical protein
VLLRVKCDPSLPSPRETWLDNTTTSVKNPGQEAENMIIRPLKDDGKDKVVRPRKSRGTLDPALFEPWKGDSSSQPWLARVALFGLKEFFFVSLLGPGSDDPG